VVTGGLRSVLLTRSPEQPTYSRLGGSTRDLRTQHNPHLKCELIRRVDNDHVAESDGAVTADTKYQLIVFRPQRGSASHMSRNDLVPGSFLGIGVCEGVLGQRCLIDTNRKPRRPCMPRAKKDY